MAEDGVEIVKYMDGKVVSTPAEKNIEYIKNKLKITDHPTPATVIVIVLIVIIFMYYIYVVFIKTDFNGIWYGPDDTSYRVYHDKYSDYAVVDGALNGYVRGDVLFVESGHNEYLAGVLSQNTIHWVRSDVIWTRPREPLF